MIILISTLGPQLRTWMKVYNPYTTILAMVRFTLRWMLAATPHDLDKAKLS